MQTSTKHILFAFLNVQSESCDQNRKQRVFVYLHRMIIELLSRYSNHTRNNIINWLFVTYSVWIRNQRSRLELRTGRACRSYTVLLWSEIRFLRLEEGPLVAHWLFWTAIRRFSIKKRPKFQPRFFVLHTGLLFCLK